MKHKITALLAALAVAAAPLSLPVSASAERICNTPRSIV